MDFYLYSVPVVITVTLEKVRPHSVPCLRGNNEEDATTASGRGGNQHQPLALHQDYLFNLFHRRSRSAAIIGSTSSQPVYRGDSPPTERDMLLPKQYLEGGVAVGLI